MMAAFGRHRDSGVAPSLPQSPVFERRLPCGPTQRARESQCQCPGTLDKHPARTAVMGIDGRDLPPRILHAARRLQLRRRTQAAARLAASSLRVFILDYFRTCATEDGHRSAGHGQGMFLSQQQERIEMRAMKAHAAERAEGLKHV